VKGRFFFVLNGTFIAAINHLLSAEGWARDRLIPHSGKTVVIRVEPLMFSFIVDGSGMAAAPKTPEADAPAEPALEVRLLPQSLIAALRGEETALRDAEIRGDAEFANALMFLARNLRWDLEEDLSRVVGDIVAHRLVSDVRRFFAWGREARGQLAASVGEYLRDEASLVAGPRHTEGFIAEVDRLRDDVARLEKRLTQLAGRRAVQRPGS
jgi:ubiquinone biosynthesis protein UbiJ